MAEPAAGKDSESSEPDIHPPPWVLAAARLLAGLTQEELARRVGVDQSIIKRYEAVKSEVRASSLSRMVEELKKEGVVFIAKTATRTVAVALTLEAAAQRKTSRIKRKSPLEEP